MTITPGVDLNEQLALADEMNLQERLRDIEKEYIAQALKRSEGNITHAAKLLGLGRTTLNLGVLARTLTEDSQK